MSHVETVAYVACGDSRICCMWRQSDMLHVETVAFIAWWRQLHMSHMETVAYAFTDIPCLDSHSPCFFIKSGLKLLKERTLEMIPKCGRAEAQSWL